MTIMLNPEIEARLRAEAERAGKDIERFVQDLLTEALDAEERDRAETIEGVRRGDQAAAEGRERPLSAFLADQRAKYGFSAEWPHVTDDENEIRDAA